MVESGVTESFKHNVKHVAAAIISIAREKSGPKNGMKKFLDLLQTAPSEEGINEPSESKFH